MEEAYKMHDDLSELAIIFEGIERATISRRKSQTTEAVANRGVDADAPRGENKDQKEKRIEKTSRCIRICEKMECDIQNLVEGKTFTPRKRNQMVFFFKNKRKGLSSIRLIR